MPGIASAISAFLGKGLRLRNAVKKSRELVARGYMFSYKVGSGLEMINTHYKVDRYAVLKELEDGVAELKRLLRPYMLPEVGMNFGYAIPNATSLEDVCAIKGRLRMEGKELRHGGVDFGTSKHVATIVLTAMRFDPETRSVLNLRYDDRTLARAKKAGMKVGSFSRKDEPRGRSTMEWGVESVLRARKSTPDAVYDLGSVGKEPMIRVLGKTPKDVLRKFKMLVKR